MKTIKQDCKAKASAFENEEWWKKYIAEKCSSYDDPDDPDMDKMKAITERNCYLIKYFADDLTEEKKLSEKTIQKHVDNVDFYLNYYAVSYEMETAEEAINEVTLDDFMADWFPRKAMWCSESAIKENCASLKKFYKWMNKNDLISDDELYDFSQFIKENKDRWIRKYQRQEAYYDRMLSDEMDDLW